MHDWQSSMNIAFTLAENLIRFLALMEGSSQAPGGSDTSGLMGTGTHKIKI